jgi:predicted DNA-binding transcriptional regulator AlpA
MIEVNHNNLPQAVTIIFQELDSIKSLLLNKTNQSESDQLLTIKEAAAEVKLSVPTLYGYVSRREIPFSKRPNSKRLWFSKQDLINWIKEGRKKTTDEISEEANSYLQIKEKKSKSKMKTLAIYQTTLTV